MSNEQRYKVMVSELVSGLDSVRIESGLQSTRREERVDIVLSELRSSFRSSSFGVYNGVIYFFGGRIYESVGYDEFADLVYEVLRVIGLPDGDYSRIEQMIRVCRRVVSSKVLELSKGVMVFRNCVYDVERGKCCRFNRKYVQFSYADYDYREGGVGVMWDRFLDEVLPNKVYQKILQEFLGSLFIDRSTAKMETMLILKGGGANGKSVIFDTVVGLLGKENVSNFGLDELVGVGVERKRNLASINGKRLNYASESGSFVIDGASGLLKALISGEPVEARPMYGENFTAHDIPPIIINTNHMPKIKDFSHGMRRRLCIIPFEVEIPRDLQDKELSKKLRIEYPYIFSWVLEGRKRFIENGYCLTRSTLLEETLEQYMYLNSSILAFMGSTGYERNATSIDEQPYNMPFADLYSQYCNWCRRNGDDIEGKRKFAIDLVECGFRRVTHGNRVCYVVYGGAAMDAALAEVREQRKEASKRVEENKKHNAEIRKEVRRRFAWKRLAVGQEELRIYLGFRVDVAGQMRGGFLDGCYTVVEGVEVYNLDLVDTLWRPAYEQRAREMIRRLEMRKERMRLLEDYSRANIDDLSEFENTGTAIQQQ